MRSLTSSRVSVLVSVSAVQRAALDFGYDFFNLLAVVEEHAGERLAFAGSGGGEGVERVVEHGKHGA